MIRRDRVKSRLRQLASSCVALVLGCGNPPDQPAAAARFPYGTNVVVDVDLLLDVVADGCASYNVIQVLQAGREVAREEPAHGGGNRISVAADQLDLHGLSYPATVSLTAKVTCTGGASAETPPTSIGLVPAAQRLGQSETRWPGYVFLPEAGGTFLFCDRGSLIRLDGQRQEVARSDSSVSCTSSTRLLPAAGRILVVDGSEVAVFGNDLRFQWHRTAPTIRFSGGQLFAVREPTGQHSVLLLDSLDLGTGSVRWTAELNGMGQTWLVAPPSLGDDGNVHLVTLTDRGPPQGFTGLAWTVDPAHPDSPMATTAGTLPSTAGNAIVVPQGLLVPGAGRIAVIETHTFDTQASHLIAFDLVGRNVLWSEPIASRVDFIEEERALLVRADDSLRRIGPDGAIQARFTAAQGEVLDPVNAHHPAGGVIVSIRQGSALKGLAFLDASLSPVWAIPYPWAFGAAFDAGGVPFYLSATLVRLYDSGTYRGLVR